MPLPHSQQTLTAPNQAPFLANVSPAERCWRLVYDGGKVVSLSEGTGKLMTRKEIFCGTKEECDAEIARLGLDRSGIDAQAVARQPATPEAPSISTLRAQRLRNQAAALLKQAESLES